MQGHPLWLRAVLHAAVVLLICLSAAAIVRGSLSQCGHSYGTACLTV